MKKPSKKDKLVNIARYFVSFVFVFGAISKLLSMPFFDNMVAELFLGKNYFDQPQAMLAVQWSSRILVALELAIGIAILQNKYWKKWVMPAALGILILFTIHLVYDSLGKPNGFVEGNCGCFGDILPMTNLESIFKNIVTFIIGLFAFRGYKNQEISPLSSAIFMGLITLFSLSFGVKNFSSQPSLDAYPVDSIFTKEVPINESSNTPNDSPEVSSKIVKEQGLQANAITNEEAKKAGEKIEKPSTKPLAPSDVTLQLLRTSVPELKSEITESNKKLVCLFSMSCSHCQEVFKDICQMTPSGKIPETYLVNFGSAYEQNYFFSQASCKYKHTLIESLTDFKRMLEGKTYPRLLLFENGKIIKEWDVDTYEKAAFMSYFGIAEIKEKQDNELNLQGGKSPW